MVMKFKVVDYVGGNGKPSIRCIRVTNALRGKPQEAGDVLCWCRDQFGTNTEGTGSSDYRWCVSRDGYSSYYFRNPEDCEWFLLKWS